ncbi:MAG: AI-2E family transporter [Betaproteobacteria bacterium]|nr:AI-2E family transporter [Betaproteobacteria bacterium]
MAERIAGNRPCNSLTLRTPPFARDGVRDSRYRARAGTLAAIGFAVSGVPAAALLGVATFFLSVVPSGRRWSGDPRQSGSHYQGQPGGQSSWSSGGVAVVSSIDNFLKPLLISRGSNLPFILVLIGVLGGVLAFGFVGVFLGPTLLAVAYRLIDEWTAQRAFDAQVPAADADIGP